VVKEKPLNELAFELYSASYKDSQIADHGSQFDIPITMALAIEWGSCH
jgi:hypothetical protein